jgi:hypothetical protein
MQRPLPFQRQDQERDLWSLGVVPALALGSLLGMIGIYWDIAWHIDFGRDTFFSPPHLLLYASMLSVLAVGVYGLLGDRRDSPYHLRLGPLRLHAGVLIVALGAALVLVSAPLDELWHRLFGPDATLWGPMHLLLFVGVMLGSMGGLVCSAAEREISGRRELFDAMTVFFAGTLLGWLVLLTAEYEFNISFFPSLFYPVLLAGLPVFALVLAVKLSSWRYTRFAGHFPATTIALGYLVFRLFVALWLMTTAGLDLAGFNRPLIPVLVFSALAVDLLRHRPVWLMSAVAGLVSLGVNAVVVNLAGGTPWAVDVLLQAAPLGIIVAVLAGLCADWTARTISPGAR